MIQHNTLLPISSTQRRVLNMFVTRMAFLFFGDFWNNYNLKGLGLIILAPKAHDDSFEFNLRGLGTEMCDVTDIVAVAHSYVFFLNKVKSYFTYCKM